MTKRDAREADWDADPREAQRWFADRIESLAQLAETRKDEAARLGNPIAACYFASMAKELRRDAETARAQEPQGG